MNTEAAQSIRMTRQRQVLLEELRKLKSHPTAVELYEIVRKRLPRVSLGTVYRNLDVLSRAGLVQRLEVSGAEMRFDGDTSPHYHVRCIRCGRVADVELGVLEGLEEKAAQGMDWSITGHWLEFKGLCPRCRGEAEGGTLEGRR